MTLRWPPSLLRASRIIWMTPNSKLQFQKLIFFHPGISMLKCYTSKIQTKWLIGKGFTIQKQQTFFLLHWHEFNFMIIPNKQQIILRVNSSINYSNSPLFTHCHKYMVVWDCSDVSGLAMSFTKYTLCPKYKATSPNLRYTR